MTNTHRSSLRTAIFAILALGSVIILCSQAVAPGPGSNEGKPDSSSGNGWTSLDDLAEKRFAVFLGTVDDQYVSTTYPKATVLRFSAIADIFTTVRTDKADVALLDIEAAKLALAADPDLAILDPDVFSTQIAMGFRKGENSLRDAFNRFLASVKADGSFQSIYQRWFENDAEKTVMPTIPPASGRKVTVAVTTGALPYLDFRNDRYVGFDIEILQRFAERENLVLNIVALDFPALFPALASGKADMIACGISITEERSESIDFSDPYHSVADAAIVKASNLSPALLASRSPTSASVGLTSQGASAAASTEPESSGFFGSLKTSFYRNLILERRWILLLRGLGLTVVMSVFSTLFGTLIGALVCAGRMSRHRLYRSLSAGYISILRGMPIVVVLMLIFYVVFASVNINPALVAILAFGLNFGAYTAEIFRSGIEGIDKGQAEAGIAMGFTKPQAFLHIILPQAVRRILPVYRGEFISLVKTTSIVGYIGVEDLTRASDIIRSRTFDAFFPLLLVAIVYFGITWLLGLALDYLNHATDPTRRR